jgi:hypothetical protein
MAAGDTGATCSRNSVRMDYLPALRQVGGLLYLAVSHSVGAGGWVVQQHVWVAF